LPRDGALSPRPNPGVSTASAKGLPPESQQEPLFVALGCASAGLSMPSRFPPRAGGGPFQMVASTAWRRSEAWLSAQAREHADPSLAFSRKVKRPDFHYSRLFAVGLLQPAATTPKGRQPGAPSAAGAAHEISGTKWACLKSGVDKDAQPLRRQSREDGPTPLSCMEETVAADAAATPAPG